MAKLPVDWHLEVMTALGVWQRVFTTQDAKLAWEQFHDIRAKGFKVRFA